MQTKSIVETLSEQQKATLRTGLFCSELKIESFHSSESFLHLYWKKSARFAM